MTLRLLDVGHGATSEQAGMVAALRGLCGHVILDSRIAARGYRFYAMADAELPSFFCKRLDVEAGTAAVMLLGGMDPKTGESVINDCLTTRDAVESLLRGDGGVWTVRLSVGLRSIPMPEFSSTFWRREPQTFVAIAQELAALRPLRGRDCAVCWSLHG